MLECAQPDGRRDTVAQTGSNLIIVCECLVCRKLPSTQCPLFAGDLVGSSTLFVERYGCNISRKTAGARLCRRRKWMTSQLKTEASDAKENSNDAQARIQRRDRRWRVQPKFNQLGAQPGRADARHRRPFSQLKRRLRKMVDSSQISIRD